MAISRRVRTGKLEKLSAWYTLGCVGRLTRHILLQCPYRPTQRETYSDFPHHIYFSPWERSPTVSRIQEEQTGNLSMPWCLKSLPRWLCAETSQRSFDGPYSWRLVSRLKSVAKPDQLVPQACTTEEL